MSERGASLTYKALSFSSVVVLSVSLYEHLCKARILQFNEKIISDEFNDISDGDNDGIILMMMMMMMMMMVMVMMMMMMMVVIVTFIYHLQKDS